MDIESFVRREKLLKLREELLAVEEDWAAGRAGITPDELEQYLEDVTLDNIVSGIRKRKKSETLD